MAIKVHVEVRRMPWMYNFVNMRVKLAAPADVLPKRGTADHELQFIKYHIPNVLM